ncbi:MAG TPA: HypC/HybG/HupF family hydrogenase formation chaperone [bacterium]|jgi:hydrogenase assembly chaperone HypC/HupF|nr:HypC/HybG/HupF family hydrogenase formation chaperone [bacterium]HNS34031.1 HypC/HybG/HupF family hydrogenase formation chaperone [bacterium]HNZ73123.1 HypC/HybG/HupF family hydrogenase formation chaperone [bacterium]HOH67002.1 HypC/HybG/HupF family hydrogenase formation chaperone [bacterium]HPN81548.1 HypC/HybG/HupF family hydrogenase formation chaperone [bacterium]
MCLAIPLQIKNISGDRAELFDGRKVNAVLIPDLKQGDWVLTVNGIIVNKIGANEAQAVLDLIGEERKNERT